MGGRFPGKGWGSAAAGCGNSGHRLGCKAGARALRKQGVVCEAAWGRGSPLQGGHGLVGESLEPNHPQLLIDSVLKGETVCPSPTRGFEWRKVPLCTFSSHSEIVPAGLMRAAPSLVVLPWLLLSAEASWAAGLKGSTLASQLGL